jgi:hypothetical protein
MEIEKETKTIMVLGHRIYSGEGRRFKVVTFGKGVGKLTPEYFELCDLAEVYVL